MDMKKILQAIDNASTEVSSSEMQRLRNIVEGKGPLNRLTAAESMTVDHYSALRTTITSPVLNVQEDARPSMIGKYFKTVEEELQESAQQGNLRTRQLAERVTTRLNELSTATLASYKKKAGADASKADKEGDFKRGNKRFSGIVKATKKQFANDTKQGVAEGSEWETRHDEFTTVGDRATPEQINKIVKALIGAAQQAGSKRGFLNQLVGKQSNGDLARMAHVAETLAKNIQKNSNAKPGSDERKELGQHLVYAVSLLKRISGEQGVAEGSLKEFAPGPGGGESGRWYTDDQLTDIVGDGWYTDLDVSGDIPKQQMIQQAQAWLDDQGYSVQVLNCKVNDDDMEWYIEGNFQNSRFAKKGVGEASLATMRDYFAGDKNAQDPTTLAKQRQWFDASKDTNGRVVSKKFRNRWEYEQWLKQLKLTQVAAGKEYNEEEEAANLLEYLRKIHKRWAIVSKRGGRPLVYFKGDGRPSKEWIEKQERRINHLKHKK